MTTHHLTVLGMTCGHCEKDVSRVVRSVDTDANIRIDRAANAVSIQTNQAITAFIVAIVAEGYEATVNT